MEEYIKSYCAGLIDGEGTITLTKVNGKYRFPTIQVASTTIELLNELKLHYGGVISSKKTYQPHHKPSYHWTLTNQKAMTMIMDILPYLREPKKRERGQYLIENYDKSVKRNGKYTEDDKLYKLEFETGFFKL